MNHAHAELEPNLADELPAHVRYYVTRIRTSMFGDQRVVEFKPGGIKAIDERDIIDIAELLITHPDASP